MFFGQIPSFMSLKSCFCYFKKVLVLLYLLESVSIFYVICGVFFFPFIFWDFSVFFFFKAGFWAFSTNYKFLGLIFSFSRRLIKIRVVPLFLPQNSSSLQFYAYFPGIL